MSLDQSKSQDDLEAALLQAHAVADHPALVDLYAQAAEFSAANGDTDRAGFYLTHAWIFALETNHPDEAILKQKLSDQGRVD